MKTLLLKFGFIVLGSTFLLNINHENTTAVASEDFQGKAYYVSKSKMNLGNWGKRLSEAQKKDVAARMKQRLEKIYILSFNKEESFYEEEEKIDALSGATDSWGKNFAPGKQYKNVKTNTQIQNQEFYGKQFLVKDSLQPITWKIGGETKTIGQYNCMKATALIPTNQLTWYAFSWDKLRNKDNEEVAMTEVEAWFTPQVPVGHGPSEYWGLAGLILEVSAGNTTLLCTKIVLNPKDKIEIKAPTKGKEITKSKYTETIFAKMQEFRDNRGRRNRR